MTSKRVPFYILLIFLLLFQCDGEDTEGIIAIEYSGAWSASVVENYYETTLEGSGNCELVYTNPDILSVTATKLDTSQNKLILYIYEDDRIVSSASTREPEGSLTVEYEFPY